MEVENEKITAFYVHAPGIDNPIAILRDLNNNQEFDDDEVFFYTKDHLGSIRELVGLDGKLKQRQRYSAYGITTREKNTDEMDRLIDHAYGFTSRELDSETGLYFYRSRYYSPEMQRFVSEDSISFAGGDTNLYRYVKNNPLKFTDPKGEFLLVGALIGATSGFIGAILQNPNDIEGAAISAAIGGVSGAFGGILGNVIKKQLLDGIIGALTGIGSNLVGQLRANNGKIGCISIGSAVTSGLGGLVGGLAGTGYFLPKGIKKGITEQIIGGLTSAGFDGFGGLLFQAPSSSTSSCGCN